MQVVVGEQILEHEDLSTKKWELTIRETKQSRFRLFCLWGNRRSGDLGWFWCKTAGSAGYTELDQKKNGVVFNRKRFPMFPLSLSTILAIQLWCQDLATTNHGFGNFWLQLLITKALCVCVFSTRTWNENEWICPERDWLVVQQQGQRNPVQLFFPFHSQWFGAQSSCLLVLLWSPVVQMSWWYILFIRWTFLLAMLFRNPITLWFKSAFLSRIMTSMPRASFTFWWEKWVLWA